jgi:hypothetical protein
MAPVQKGGGDGGGKDACGMEEGLNNAITLDFVNYVEIVTE